MVIIALTVALTALFGSLVNLVAVQGGCYAPAAERTSRGEEVGRQDAGSLQ
jgi:hypothetical protein